MRAHISYLKYVLRHKLFVFIAGCRIGPPRGFPVLRHVRWGVQLLVHDWSKFTPREWSPYVHHFFNADGTRRSVRRPDGGYDPNKQGIAFQTAWLSHQRNLHHWQAWISVGEAGSLTPLPMPERYVREMLSDWMGAARAQTGRWEVQEWYAANKDKMILHSYTRAQVEKLLVTLGDG